MSPIVRALLDEFFGIDAGELAIGGISVSRLAEDYQTPLFIYDAAVLRRQLDRLRRTLPQGVDLYYSVKANPNRAIIATFVEAGLGLEVASGGELLRALAAGGAAERIVFAGPGKSKAELQLALREGVGAIHVESDEELELLTQLDGEAPVSVRFNPVAAAAGGALRTGGQPSQFGFDEERLDEVITRIISRPGLRFRGVHMFAGTQILDADVLVRQWRHAIDVAARVGTLVGAPLATVDLGGGLGIPYFDHQRALDLDAVRCLAAELFTEVERDRRLTATRFILEPGRYLTGPMGVYLCRVLAVKRSRGSTFVVVDGGMHHHLAASGNLGQVIRRDHPIVNASRLTAEPVSETVVVGPLCTPLDTIGRRARLPATKPGDLMAVLQSGAYALTASPVGFLSHPMPAEVFVEHGTVCLIRHRGTFEHPLTQLP